MTREEQIEQKAKGLGQKYFPNKYNIWARPNHEAQCVEFACKEMVKWVDEHPKDAPWEGILIHGNNDAYRLGYKNAIEKACEWLRRTQPQAIFPDTMIERFKKAMNEQQ